MRPALSTLHTQDTPCRTAVLYARVTRPPRPACGAGGRGAVVCAARRCRPRRLVAAAAAAASTAAAAAIAAAADHVCGAPAARSQHQGL